MIDDDIWMDMLDDRNNLTHDYDGTFAEEVITKIIENYIPVFERFKEIANEYLSMMD